MIKTALAVALAGIVAAAASPALAQTNGASSDTGSAHSGGREPRRRTRSTPRVRLNFENADLMTLVRAISEITGRRFLIGGRVRDIRATIVSPTPVTLAEAYQAFVSTLEVNGLTLVRSGAYEVIMEATDSARDALPVSRSGEASPPGDERGTVVVHLNEMSAEDAARLLEHFRSANGQVVPVAP